MYRILVVDDEEEIRHAVRRRLTREGYTVDQAGSQEEAVAAILAAEPPYDLILTDMVMEDPESGVRTLEAALSRDIFSEVIVLTAYGNVGNAVECMRRGAFDYVEKNIPGVDVYELLIMKINQAMERRRMSLTAIRRYAEVARREKIELPSGSRPRAPERGRGE
jgi:DNA-binding NtrC family response regulator